MNNRQLDNDSTLWAHSTVSMRTIHQRRRSMTCTDTDGTDTCSAQAFTLSSVHQSAVPAHQQKHDVLTAVRRYFLAIAAKAALQSHRKQLICLVAEAQLAKGPTAPRKHGRGAVIKPRGCITPHEHRHMQNSAHIKQTD